MSEPYCHACYRTLESEDAVCRSCAARHALTRPAARLPLMIGAIGLPLLLFGMLGFSTTACIAATVIAGAAALWHVLAVSRV